MDNQDSRWVQRFDNFKAALKQLQKAVAKSEDKGLSELEQQGLIQAFEYTHELAWKCLKDFLLSRGNTEIYGSRDATREAFQLGLITNGEVWMDMIKSRNQTSHTYLEEVANQIAASIVEEYYPLFLDFREKMNELL